jgi:hypothetical protein
MQAGLKTGEVQSLLSLSSRVHLAFEEIETILEKLLSVKIVRQLSETDWVLIRDSEHISLHELSELFLFDVSSLPFQEGDEGIHAWFVQFAKHFEESKNMTLQSLLDKA